MSTISRHKQTSVDGPYHGQQATHLYLHLQAAGQPTLSCQSPRLHLKIRCHPGISSDRCALPRLLLHTFAVDIVWCPPGRPFEVWTCGSCLWISRHVSSWSCCWKDYWQSEEWRHAADGCDLQYYTVFKCYNPKSAEDACGSPLESAFRGDSPYVIYLLYLILSKLNALCLMHMLWVACRSGFQEFAPGKFTMNDSVNFTPSKK
jgi:hypothetical protein